jgi:hypothetical protein
VADSVAKIKLALEGASAVEQGLAKVEQKVAGLGKSLIGLAGGLSVAGFAAFVRSSINAADEMAKLSQKTGVAMKDVAGLQLAFRQSGVEATQLVPIMAKLSNAAVNGSEALKAMGVQSRNADGSLKGTRQLLGEVAEKFSGYQDGATKTALAVKLFGEEGAKILPLLNQGAEGLAQFDEMAQRLGLTLDEETGKRAEQFNDTLDLIGQGASGVGRQVAAQLLPVLNTMAGEFFRTMTEGDNLRKVADGLGVALKGLYSVAVGGVQIFANLGRIVGASAAAIMQVMEGNFSAARSIMQEAQADNKAAWEATTASIKRVWESAGDSAVEAGAKIVGATKRAAPEMQKLVTAARPVRDEFSKLADQLAGKIVDGWAAAEAGAQGYNKAQQDFLRLTASPQWAAFTNEQRAQIAILSEKLILQEREAAALKAIATAQDAARKAYADNLNLQTQSAEAAARRVQEMELETEALGMAQALQISMAEAVELTTIARLKERQVAAMGNEELVLELQREIEAREKLVAMLGDRRVQDASKKAADDAAAEWQKASDKIEDMLTDALMRGFENGKSFGQNLADSVKNIFKTYVAQAIAKAITGAIMAALAQTAWARALSGMFGGGGGGMGGMAMNAAGSAAMNSMFGGGGSAGFAASAGQLAGGVALNAAGAGGAGYAMAVPGLTSSAAGSQAAMLAAQTSGFGAAGVTATAAAGGSTAAAGASAASSALAAIPVWGWIALAAIVFWDDLFGRKLKEAGSMLKIRGDEITSTGYEFRSGGLFRSDKWSETGDRTAQDQQVIQQFRNVQQASAGMAMALGYSADTINGFSGTVRLNMKGVKTAQEAQERLNEALEDFQWQLWRSVPGMNMTKEKFKEMLADVQKAIEQAGISAQSIGDIIMQGMLGRMNQAQVGQALAEQVLGGIYQTIASPFAAQIAGAFQAQIITPVFTAILAGVPISQAISQQAIANVVATAQQAAAALNAIFSDAGFRQAIGDIQQAISGVASASVQPAAQVRGLTGAISTAGNAAASARAQWKSLADSLIDEIRRIRGVIVGDTSAGLAYTQSQFAIATAQARAGDKDAAARLPEISRALEELLRENSESLSDFRASMAANMVSLMETNSILAKRYRFKVPSYDVGTNYVRQDMLAMVHKGEAIVPEPYNPAAGGVDNAQLLRVMTALLDEMREVNSNSSDIAAASRGTHEILDRVSQGGEALLTEEVA